MLRLLGVGDMDIRISCAVAILSSTLICSCTSLNFVHDPQTGVITRQQVEGFLKSTRCEILTYFEANRRRKSEYFDLSNQLFAAITLDLNVQDTAGFPQGGTSIDRLHTASPTESWTWHFGPTLDGQNTYDMILSLLVPQNAKLDFSAKRDPSISCYSGPPTSDFEGLAHGEYAAAERFTRIRVNGMAPLAAWLLDVGAEMWPNVEAAKHGETAYPVQMAYTFTVQFTAGLEVKYSLTNPVWSPLAPNAAASSQQTSKLQFWLNGADASLANGATTGSAVIGGGSTIPYEPIPYPPVGAAPGKGRAVAGPARWQRGVPHGFLITPLPLIAPKPVH